MNIEKYLISVIGYLFCLTVCLCVHSCTCMHTCVQMYKHVHECVSLFLKLWEKYSVLLDWFLNNMYYIIYLRSIIMKSSKMERKEVCYLKNMVNLKFNDDISRWELPDIYMYKINFALLTKIIKEKNPYSFQ